MAKFEASDISRRGFVAASGAAALVPGASAFGGARTTPQFHFPARIGYLRFGPDGYKPAGPSERDAWMGFAVRMGRLVDDVRPIGFGAMTAADIPPAMDEGASASLAARAAAARQGLDYALIYSVGTTTPEPVEISPEEVEADRFYLKRMRGLFRSVEERTAPLETTTGEAHLLSVEGGPALASVWAHPPEIRGGLLAKRRSMRELDVLEALTERLEQRIRGFADDLYRLNRSIAD